MDLRVKKTKNAIINAFLVIRAKKPLERITVKELADKAMINKATFYLHYRDIYDLSETLENELFENVFNSIEHPDAVISAPDVFVKELLDGFTANRTLIDIIFSNDRSNILVDRIESKLKSFIFEKNPQYKDVDEINVLLTYTIKGGYYAFVENKSRSVNTVAALIGDVAALISEKIALYL